MTSEDFRNNPLFFRNQFPASNIFGIPEIKRSKVNLEDVAFIGYDKLSDDKTDHIVHFFLDDYKFESLWKDPEHYVERLQAYKAVLSPQFSLYAKMPLALQVYNTFRNRWCGAFLQSKGVKVIPTVLWGKPESF